MADSVTNVQVKAYTDLVLMRAQQMESVTRAWVQTKDNVVGESVSFDRIGLVEMIPKPSRNAPTPQMDPNHERRWATLAAYQGAIFVDPTDLVTMISNPTSDYVRALAAAVGRQWDRLVLAAATGTAITGSTGVTGASASGSVGTETWPVTDRKNISHQIAAGAAGMTVAKLRQGQRFLNSLKVGTDRVCFMDSFAQEDLLASVEVTSSDYASIKALVRGDVNTFLGLEFQYPDATLMSFTGTEGTATMSAVIMERGAVGLGIGIDKVLSIDKRPDLSNSTQVYIEMMGGAVRRDGERIVEIQYVQG